MTPSFADFYETVGELVVVSGQVSGMDAIGEPTVQEISPHARAAVGQLFDDHADAIFAYAARRVGPGLAVDVVSDVFLVALDRFESFHPDLGGARGWLFGIANNVLRRHWRTEARRLRALARYTSFIENTGDPHVAVDRRLDAQSDAARVIERVIHLPEDDRDLVIMFAWQRLAYADIAAAMDVPVGTVRSRIHRLRRQLGADPSEGTEK